MSRLWVRSFSFLGIVMDTVIRLPEVYKMGNLVMDTFVNMFILTKSKHEEENGHGSHVPSCIRELNRNQ